MCDHAAATHGILRPVPLPVAYIYILFYSILEEADMRLSNAGVRMVITPGYRHTAQPKSPDTGLMVVPWVILDW
jgi:hypothetical protein